jgi:peptidoglycan hydrolase-like protein with peptidoglycan-binding domain
MSIATRRVLPGNAAEVRDQLDDIGRRVARDMLQRGDRGDAVADLQNRLRAFGLYHGKASGVFDRATERAVRRYQDQAGITVDGVVGPQTLGSMRQHTLFVKDNFETAAHQGQRGLDIRHAEKMLKDLGMAPGAVDGLFDQDTAAAVKRFRAGDPTLPDGARIDARTFARMREAASRPLQQGDRTRGVGVLEKNLKRLGIDPGAVDTSFTANTAEAVRKFQRRNGMPVTGVADPATRAAIQKAVDKLAPTSSEVLRGFSTTAPKSDYRRVSVDGQTLNKRTQEMLQRAQYIMRNKFGHKNFDFQVVQGSYTSAVAASGGTHDRGGAMDIHTRSYSKRVVDDMVKAMRMAGFAAWSRGRGHDSFPPHIHAIAIGDRELSSAAAAQVQEYFNGGDGLVGSRPDPDRGLGRSGLIPDWAKRFDR